MIRFPRRGCVGGLQQNYNTTRKSEMLEDLEIAKQSVKMRFCRSLSFRVCGSSKVRNVGVVSSNLIFSTMR